MSDVLREALEAAEEWAAGYPLGGDMDRIAAADVLAKARAALSAARAPDGELEELPND